MNNETVVSVSHLYKSYGEKNHETVVLKDISFQVRAGEFVSVMGPSGCGKSTLLYLIGGLDKPSAGTILTCGERLSELSDDAQSRIRCQSIGFVFQFYNLVQNLTVEENILLPLVMAGKQVYQKEIQARLERLLQLMGLEDKRDSIPSKLSGGQQQRVSIARAVISRPKLILADEPTGNLDSHAETEVMRIFREINRGLGITFIMVTHSREAAAYGSRVLYMKDGTILKDSAVGQA